ncbi:MAG: SMC-Scp complex subunit ScpB [Alphaproteobacteria bacterium]|nr:SMC-Scp complex subunit ScpB [Alphaproteobacteria bacterium]
MAVPPMVDLQSQVRVIEALLFASDRPLGAADLAPHLPEGADVAALVGELARHYQGRGVNLVTVAGKWALRTAPDLARHLESMREVPRPLSRAALETLAIIAYNQPVTRAEIEEIRGTPASRGTLDILLEIGWIKPRGRRKVPGRPVTWVTSDDFLSHFGLEALEDLPGVDELRAAGLLDRTSPVTVLSEHAPPDTDDDPADDNSDGDDEAAAAELAESAADDPGAVEPAERSPGRKPYSGGGRAGE